MACSSARPRPRPRPLSRESGGGAFGRRFRLRTKRPMRVVSTTIRTTTTTTMSSLPSRQREDEVNNDNDSDDDDVFVRYDAVARRVPAYVGICLFTRAASKQGGVKRRADVKRGERAVQSGRHRRRHERDADSYRVNLSLHSAENTGDGRLGWTRSIKISTIPCTNGVKTNCFGQGRRCERRVSARA